MTECEAPPPYHGYGENSNQVVEADSGGRQQVSFSSPPNRMVFVDPNQQAMIRMPTVKAPQPGPPDFLLFALITMIVCAILNPTSMFFGIPAIVFAAASRSNRVGLMKNFKNSQSYSNYALGLTISCIIYTLVWAVIIAGLAVTTVVYGGFLSGGGGCRLCQTPANGYYCLSPFTENQC